MRCSCTFSMLFLVVVFVCCFVVAYSGLGSVAEKLTEFSLAKKAGANECIDGN